MIQLSRRGFLGAGAAAALVSLTACGSSDTTTGAAPSGGSSAGAFPVTIPHAFGEAVIEAKPERVATVGWGNHEVPLALGLVPVGMPKTTYGDDDTDGVHPWTKTKLDELGAAVPPLFDETDSIDFEAVADTAPDVILAAYSGLTQADYDTLGKIAPVVAYPKVAWGTGWRDVITMNATALGLRTEGDDLVKQLEALIATELAKYPQLAGKSAMMTYLSAKDLSQINCYTTLDSRVQYLVDLGLATPAVVTEKSAGSQEFFFTQSAEQADVFNDVDIIMGYGDDALVATLQKDKLLSQIAAVQRGSLAMLTDNTPLASAANPTALSIPWALPQLLKTLAEAADRV